MINRCSQEGRRVEHSLQRAVDQLREASSNANAALRAENARLAALAAELQEEVKQGIDLLPSTVEGSR